MTDRRREIVVLRAGWLTTIQDGGRPGLAHLAVPHSGAVDTKSWRLANRIVGNPEDEAALETTLTGVTIQPSVDCSVAVTGAQALITLDGRHASWGLPLYVKAGQILDIGPATAGVRNYVAISGGIDVPLVLRSRSTDILSGLGPPPLSDGQIFALGPVKAPAAVVDFAPYPNPPTHLNLLLHIGPRNDWLTDTAQLSLSREIWHVGTNSNRIALRLDGASLKRSKAGELPSEGIVSGAVQVPPDGQPLIFLADHPTTGGYPVVGVIDQSDLAACGQAGPGIAVSFRVVSNHSQIRST